MNDPAKTNSAALTEGPARAMLRAVNPVRVGNNAVVKAGQPVAEVA